MPAPENRKSVEDFFDRVLNAGDTTALAGMAHPDVVVAGTRPGVASLLAKVEGMRRMFSNPEFKVIETIAEGEKVVVRYSAKGTHASSFLGLPASGRRLSLWGMMVFRFEAGGIAEFWELLDVQDLLKQLREG